MATQLRHDYPMDLLEPLVIRLAFREFQVACRSALGDAIGILELAPCPSPFNAFPIHF
ncbi:MAG: hypothetical protein JSR88_11400, partial [Proteobacteria bacterium]|nr:hypothetical protein [Pseudomonadota bacterium]